MVTQNELDVLNKWKKGAYDVILNGKLDSKNRYLFFISINSDTNNNELLISKNDLVRKFISLDTVYRYIRKHCYNARQVVIKVEDKNDFEFLENVKFVNVESGFFSNIKTD